jgi:hypothetical protein
MDFASRLAGLPSVEQKKEIVVKNIQERKMK